jgi:class 3 adenylate cyclase/CRP-like cAMP-binding protein
MNVLEHFRKPTKVLTLAPGTVLFRAGEAADAMYVLLEGSADILVGSMVVEVAEPGSLLGELALVDAGERSAGVVARTECRVVRITVAEFDLLVREAPAFSRVVMKLMAERLRRMNENLGELEKRIFHLKALYDLSREIGLLSGTESVTDNLLMMVLGTFGVERGLIVLRDARSNQVQRFAHRGIDDADAVAHTLAQHHVAQPLPSVDLHICIPFDVDQGLKGSIGLGEKLTGDDYTPEDSELLLTLANQGAVAIRNARAHEEVVRYAKELADSLRRIQILESMKTSLAKFVPKTVQDLIEKSPEAPVLEPREADVSVLFADITGYSRLTSSMAPERLNQLVELYFAAFLDEILRRGGDVNETAGDGLMVIFQKQPRGPGGGDEDHALNATRAAFAIRQRTAALNEEYAGVFPAIALHMGINTGQALVGATKLSGAASERWTFTATGPTTNIAARFAGAAEGGDIVVGQVTADRIAGLFVLESLGERSFKNVSQPLPIYRVIPPGVYSKVT